jgi:hypothetical protein
MGKFINFNLHLISVGVISGHATIMAGNNTYNILVEGLVGRYYMENMEPDGIVLYVSQTAVDLRFLQR